MSTSTATLNQDYSVSSLDYVVTNRLILIDEIKKNKEKHTEIYNAACSGYWIAAKTKIEDKSVEFSEALSKLNKQYESHIKKSKLAIENQEQNNFTHFPLWLDFKNSLDLTHPVHHFDDYDRVIKMLEFSVSENIKLNVNEFEKYARNNWEWKNDFCSQSQTYLQNLNNSSGACFTTGSYLSSFLISGVKAF